MNILIQLPTLGRWGQVMEVLTLFLEKMSGKHQLVFNINCDNADISMNNDVVKKSISDLFYTHMSRTELQYKPMYDIWFDQNTTKISSMNAHINMEHFDIILGASDDMIPIEQDWDHTIAMDMIQTYSDLDGCISYHDGHQEGNRITFSIMGKKLYDHFGYIYHPDYVALYCDDEFTDEVNKLGKVTYIKKVLFAHEHWNEEGNRNSGNQDFAANKTLQFAGRDGMVYQKRKELGFPKERITND